MSDTGGLREAFEQAREQFEQYRASVLTAIEERPAGEVTRALDAILPDLVYYEGQAFAAGLGLAKLGGGASRGEIGAELSRALIEQQAARRSTDFLAGIARMIARTNQAPGGTA